MRTPNRRTTPKTLFGGLLALLLAGGLVLPLPGCGNEGPPSFSNTAYWRAKLAEGDPDAIATMKEGGERAVPLVITLLGDRDENVVAQGALVALQIGEKAAAAVPALFAALDRFPGQPNVLQAIRKMGDAALDPIVKILETGTDQQKEQVVGLLNGRRTPATKALPALVQILKSSAPDKLKLDAMTAIGSLGVEGEPARGLLEELSAKEGSIGLAAQGAIKRLDSAQKMAEIRREEAAGGH